MAHIVVGVTGASGIILASRAHHWLTELNHKADFIVSSAAKYTAVLEKVELPPSTYKNNDFAAPHASGSARHDGMLIAPCSMATLAAIAMGLSDNLIRRAADVCLKERRPLVIIPREAPLSQIHLENMLKITQMGGIILPPSPAWYLLPKTLLDVEDQIIGRAFDFLGLDAPFCPRWTGSGS